jgi:hypothetical protein
MFDDGQREGTTRASRRMVFISIVDASLLRYQEYTMRIDCYYLQIPDNYPAYLDLQFGNIELHVAQSWRLEYTTVMQEHLFVHIDHIVSHLTQS